MRHKARDSGGKYVLLLLLICCSVRDSTRICYVDVGFVEDLFFPLWRADLKMSGFVEKLVKCVWLEAVSGKKRLRIQKYTRIRACGWGLSLHAACMSCNFPLVVIFCHINFWSFFFFNNSPMK